MQAERAKEDQQDRLVQQKAQMDATDERNEQMARQLRRAQAREAERAAESKVKKKKTKKINSSFLLFCLYKRDNISRSFLFENGANIRDLRCVLHPQNLQGIVPTSFFGFCFAMIRSAGRGSRCQTM